MSATVALAIACLSAGFSIGYRIGRNVHGKRAVKLIRSMVAETHRPLVVREALIEAARLAEP